MLLTISSRSTNGPAPSTLIPPQHCTPSHAASQSAYKWHGSIGSHKRSIWDGVSWCLISAAILGELDLIINGSDKPRDLQDVDELTTRICREDTLRQRLNINTRTRLV